MASLFTSRRADGTSKRGSAAYYWMVLPALALFFFLHTLPVLQGIYYSFTDFAGYGDYDFVGLRNYVNLFRDDGIWESYLFTVQFAVTATILTNVIALALALGLNARIRFRTTLRAIFFVPNVLAILIVSYVFNYLFSHSLPYLAGKLGIGWLSEPMLADPDRAWIPIVIVAVWQAVAFNVIIFLAGLQTIPGELHEAALMDGAGPWQRFRSITLPMIMPFVTINMILALKNFLQVFDQVVALTNGGPGTSTTSVSFLIYNMGFLGGEYSYQTANAVLYFLLIIAISLFQLRLLRSREVTY
ncbi:carbohydrate ABC transporter permease [Streptomyces sp. 7-21]|jgi:raffinose/stachyose/melibiose transport system permease protein|uniref:carbohydrate ABC transporter permease n=1 Tax=Streptomyces sp. 7-21 TaxID=2802283 RepID=UPI00191ED339|nr:sugar ABC transporter permease [Streptomyces sp. 7-21]MBL1065971.1 sugar ABC transporter permease [Streptomyces sp. 7-21]